MGRRDKKPSAPPPPPPPPADDPSSESEDVASSSFSGDIQPHGSPSTPVSKKTLVSPPSHHQDSDFDGEDEEEEVIPPPKSTHVSRSKPKPVSKSDDDEEEEVEEDEDDEEEEKEVTPPAKHTHKPTSKSTSSKSKPGSKSATLAALSSAKRPAQNDTSITKPSEKRAKKEKPTSPGPTTAATPAKPQFQRIFDEEDELHIVQGMVEYRNNKGVDPMSNVDDFAEFIKRSVKVPDVKKDQIVSKVRRLRKRFLNLQKKSKPPTKSQERDFFDLGMKLWGGGAAAAATATPTAASIPTATAIAPTPTAQKSNGVVARHDDEDGDEEELDEEMMDLGFALADEAVVKRVMGRLEGAEKEELRRKLKEAGEASLQAYFKRLEVLTFATKRLLDDVRRE